MYITLYKFLNICFSPILFCIIFYRYLTGKEDKSRIRERFGVASKKRKKKKLIWIHAVSVGETLAVLPLLNLINNSEDYNVLLTSGTIAAAKIIQKKLPKNCIHQYVPIENYFTIRKFLKHWKPNLAIFVESEFWPCILSETSKICKIISINTQISDSSFKKWLFFKHLFNEMWDLFSTFMPQSIEHKNKLLKLGAKNVHYFGNIKYSSPDLPYDKKSLTQIASKFSGRKIILFASTHEGEEAIFINVYKNIQDKTKSALAVIAIRHTERRNQVLNLLKKYNYNVALRSKKNSITSLTDFYIIDTMGELGLFYRLSPIVVMGGSFIDHIGGHNPIEPAKLNTAIIIGPYTHKTKEICSDFKKTTAAIFVQDGKGCIKAIKDLWKNKRIYNQYVDNALKLSKNNDMTLPSIMDYISANYLK